MILKGFIERLQANRVALARLWPAVRETYPQLPDSVRTTAETGWNAAVYVQRKLELQVYLGLRGRPGVTITEQPEDPPLGVFAGLPGDPGTGRAPPADDPRFAIPRIEIAWPLVGGDLGGTVGWGVPAAVVVGAWIIAGLGALLLVLKVTGALGLVERHWAHTSNLESQEQTYRTQVQAQQRMYREQEEARLRIYQEQVDDARRRGLPPPAPPVPAAPPNAPPPPRPPSPPSGWSDMILPLALIAGAVVVVPKLLAAR